MLESTLASPQLIAPGRPRPDWVGLACLFALTLALSWVSFEYTRFEAGVSAVWTANGLLLGAMLLTDRGQWPGWLLAAGIGQFAARLVHADAWPFALGLVLANLLECFLVAAWVRQGGALSSAPSLSRLARRAFAGTLAACAVSATLALPLLVARSGGSPGLAWLLWYGAHVLGLVVVATLIVCTFQPDVKLLPTSRAEAVDYAICLLLLLLVLAGVLTQGRFPLLFLSFLPLLLLAWRHGLSGMVVGVCSLALASAFAAAHDTGPFALIQHSSPPTRLLFWQAFVASACLLSYSTAVTLTQRRYLEAKLRRSESRFRLITENSHDLIVRRRVGDEQRAYVSPASLEVLGYEPAELPELAQLVHPDDRAQFAALYAQLFSGGIETARATFRILHRDGRYRWFEASARRVESDEGQQVIFSGRDVSERVRAQQAQHAVESQLRAITDHLPAMVARFDRDARYLYANARSRAMNPGVELLGKTLAELRGPERYAELSPHVDAVLRGEPQEFDTWLDTTEGRTELRTQFVPDVGGDGHVQGFYSVSFDITEAKHLERELAKLARFDPLTGLANRLQFEERLRRAVSRATRTGAPLMVLALDLDRFKQVNDSLGHAAGDEVLKEFARRVQSAVYDVDTVARLGGDEFMVLVEYSATRESAELMAAHIIEAMRPPIELASGPVQVAASIGIGLQQPVRTGEQLLACADRALYEAKAKGRNTWVVCVE
jgi:diguanylate cyclase (GGDEF)-like protein/PAS domain S-box-containing protein